MLYRIESIYEDVIFAKMLRDSGKMSELDFQTYRSLYLNMTNFLHRPDVIVFLDVSPETALARVQQRERDCESGISLSYLKQLKEGYEEWLQDVSPRIPVIRIDWNEFCDVDEVVKAIDKKLEERNGLVF